MGQDAQTVNLVVNLTWCGITMPQSLFYWQVLYRFILCLSLCTSLCAHTITVFSNARKKYFNKTNATLRISTWILAVICKKQKINPCYTCVQVNIKNSQTSNTLRHGSLKSNFLTDKVRGNSEKIVWQLVIVLGLSIDLKLFYTGWSSIILKLII